MSSCAATSIVCFWHLVGNTSGEEMLGNDEDLQAQSVNLYLGAFYKETWNVDKGQQ